MQAKYEYFNKNTTGSSIPHINQSLFYKLEVPIPPKEEQEEIVAELEKRLSDYHRGFINAEAEMNNISHYRNSILQQAISGNLTDKWRAKNKKRSDTSQLIENIIKWKKTEGLLSEDYLYNPGRIKKPAYIPKVWQWITLDLASAKIFDGSHFSPKNRPQGDFKYITAKNVKEFRLDLSNVTYISKDDHEVIYKRADVRKNDVFYIKDGVTAGIAAVNTLTEEVSILSSLAVFRVNEKYIDPNYLAIFLNSPAIRNLILSQVYGVAITRLTLTKLRAAFVALPTIHEQKEIIKQVDLLFFKAESLEKEQTKTIDDIMRLRNSLFQIAFTGGLAKHYDKNLKWYKVVFDNLELEKNKILKSFSQNNKNKTLGLNKIKAMSDKNIIDILLNSPEHSLPIEEVWQQSSYYDKENIEGFYEELESLIDGKLPAKPSVIFNFTDSKKIHGILKLKDHAN